MNEDEKLFLTQSLLTAAKYNDVDIVRDIIEKNPNDVSLIDCREKSELQSSMLHYACTFGYPELAAFLIRENANVHVQDGFKKLPLHYACQYGHFGIVQNLIPHMDLHRNEAKVTFLQLAVVGGHFEVAKALLQFEAPVDQLNEDGETALFTACSMDSGQMVQLLLDHGSSMSTRVYRVGDMPLHYACRYNARIAAGLLVERGASIHEPNLTGLKSTPISIARNFGYDALANELIQMDAEARKREWSKRPKRNSIIASARSSDKSFGVANVYLNKGRSNK